MKILDAEMMELDICRPVSVTHPIRITPGPFEVSPAVLHAPSRAFAGHRTSAFREIIKQNASMLLQAFEIQDRENFFPVVLPGTGTAAMEAMIAAITPNLRPLVLVNGRFSRRLADIAEVYNSATLVIDFGVGGNITIDRVEETLDRYPDIGAVVFGVQDTREAILNDVESLCAVAKQRNKLVCVDAVSSLVCEEVRPDKLKIDCFTESSGKGIRGLPGLGIVCARIDLFENLNPNCCKSYYLNLYEHYRIQRDLHETLFADPVALHYALHEALRELIHEGVSTRRIDIQRRTDLVRQGIRDLNLQPLWPYAEMPHSVTSILLPPGHTFPNFQQELQRRGFLVYPGSSAVRDCIQIGTAGFLTDTVLQKAINAIDDILKKSS